MGSRKILLRAAQVYRKPICSDCKSRMLTFVMFEGDERMRVGCSVCKRLMSDGEFEEIEKEWWGFLDKA